MLVSTTTSTREVPITQYESQMVIDQLNKTMQQDNTGKDCKHWLIYNDFFKMFFMEII